MRNKSFSQVPRDDFCVVHFDKTSFLFGSRRTALLIKERFQNSLGRALRDERKRRQFLQAELAQRSNISIPTLRLLERGRGNLASWESVIKTLRLGLHGKNLPSGKNIGERVALIRRRHRISQRELAALAQVSHPTIVKLERYAQGRLSTLDRVLRILGAGPILVPRGKSPKFFSHAAVSSAHHGWETPKGLLEILYQVFGRFDLDPCSPTADKRRAPVRARLRFTAEDDGLSLPWHGLVFLNPPYGRAIAHWTKKAVEEVECGNAKTVVAVLPVRTDTAWWHDHIAQKAKVLFLRGRLSFGKSGQSAPFPSALIIWGGTPTQIDTFLSLVPSAWKP